MMDDYLGLSVEIVAEIGRVTVIATAVEEVAYRVAEGVELDELLTVAGKHKKDEDRATQIRKRSGTNVAEALVWVARRMPAEIEACGVDPVELEEWGLAVDRALRRRHEVVHGYIYEEESELGEIAWRRRKTRDWSGDVPLVLDEIVAVRDELESVRPDGARLWAATDGLNLEPPSPMPVPLPEEERLAFLARWYPGDDAETLARRRRREFLGDWEIDAIIRASG